MSGESDAYQSPQCLYAVSDDRGSPRAKNKWTIYRIPFQSLALPFSALFISVVYTSPGQVLTRRSFLRRRAAGRAKHMSGDRCLSVGRRSSCWWTRRTASTSRACASRSTAPSCARLCGGRRVPAAEWTVPPRSPAKRFRHAPAQPLPPPRSGRRAPAAESFPHCVGATNADAGRGA